MQKTIRKSLGALGESLAYKYLCSHGLTLVQKNFRCYFGEIDLIMLEQSTLVFIEVRVKNKPDPNCAIFSIDKHKQFRIKKTAEYFLNKTALCQHDSSRFDIIAYFRYNNKLRLQWIKNGLMTD